jgi:hypothetical protein
MPGGNGGLVSGGAPRHPERRIFPSTPILQCAQESRKL